MHHDGLAVGGKEEDDDAIEGTKTEPYRNRELPPLP